MAKMEALEWSAHWGISNCCHTLPTLKAGFDRLQKWQSPCPWRGEKIWKNRKGGSLFALPFDLGFYLSPTECTWTWWCYRFRDKLLILKLKFQTYTISLYGLSSHLSGLSRCLCISVTLHDKAFPHSIQQVFIEHTSYATHCMGVGDQMGKRQMQIQSPSWRLLYTPVGKPGNQVVYK